MPGFVVRNTSSTDLSTMPTSTGDMDHDSTTLEEDFAFYSDNPSAPLEAVLKRIHRPQGKLVEYGPKDQKEDAEAEMLKRVARNAQITRLSAQPPRRMTMQKPPGNFGAVYPGRIYRSQYPEPANFDFLATLRLKTIITLVPEPIPEVNSQFCKDNNIHHFQIPLPANKDGIKMEQCAMSRVLSVVLDHTNWPILIHCNKGKHRTGCTVASFRKALGVPSDEIVEEYIAYSQPKSRDWDKRFIESFDARTMTWFARMNGFEIEEDSDDITVVPSYQCSRLTTYAPVNGKTSAAVS